MASSLTFDELLSAIGELPIEDQKSLVDIVRRRLTELRRDEIARECAEAMEEFKAGNMRVATVDEIMAELRNPE